ncbi:MAG: hypothetical protein EBR34_08225 [Sphingomonadaceae bacterium]|nr:hypothetical protein [Sphingomonadaceae bacterium]
MLHRLRAVPVPAELAMIDTAVLDGLAAIRREASAAPRLMGFAAAFALVVGLAGGGLAGGEAASAQPLSPFAPDNPLAPSTLLDVHP